MTWTYHTAERMGWARWTRKRRRKFKARYYRQHGRRFGWFVSEYAHGEFRITVDRNMIFFQRHFLIGLGATIKE